ncbi:MAG: hypothetical protein JRE47_10950 [Deltaproteobacteria bacterium]|nr:hypothetical protein [Deltaproteobacteria bacterium]
MKYLIDTNVLSEAVKTTPDESVIKMVLLFSFFMCFARVKGRLVRQVLTLCENSSTRSQFSVWECIL